VSRFTASSKSKCPRFNGGSGHRPGRARSMTDREERAGVPRPRRLHEGRARPMTGPQSARDEDRLRVDPLEVGSSGEPPQRSEDALTKEGPRFVR